MNHVDNDEQLRTIRNEFALRGVSIAEWSRQRGYSSALVYQVLRGEKKCLRGQSHQIAMALGLKDGIGGGLPAMPF